MALGIGGATTLGEIRTVVRQESDTENDPHIGDTELNGYINSAYFELYDLLVTSFGDDYYSAQATLTGVDGVTQLFPLPDGARYSAAPAHYKGLLIEAQLGGGNNPYAWVTLKKFQLAEKNRYNPINQIIVPGYQWPRYRLHGSNVMFQPIPTANITVKLWYAPKLVPLAADADVIPDYSGWNEYIVVEAAIRCLAKQERDTSVMAARKLALKARIEAAAANRDLGEPNTVTETQGDGFGALGGYGAYGPWG